MPWITELDRGQETRRPAGGLCPVPNYGEDEAAARRAARKETKRTARGETFVAVYLVPPTKEQVKAIERAAAERARRGSGAARMLIAAVAGLAGDLPPMPHDPPFLRDMGRAARRDRSRGRWEHCTPELLLLCGPDFCAKAARRGCLCGFGPNGSHDHWVIDDAEEGLLPPVGEFLRNMGASTKRDNGDGTITILDGNGTPRLVVGKNMHDQVVAYDLESMSTTELMRAARRATGTEADLGSRLLEIVDTDSALKRAAAALPRIECGHPTPEGPCCRLQGHVSETHWARMPVAPEGPVDTGALVAREAEVASFAGTGPFYDARSTLPASPRLSHTGSSSEGGVLGASHYYDISSSYPAAMLENAPKKKSKKKDSR